MRRIVITPQSPAQGWNHYWVRRNTNIGPLSFRASNDNIKSRREPKKNGDIQGHLCPTLEDLGLIACYIKDTELSLLVIYLLPAAHTLRRWFYLHLHPPSPLHPWSFGPVSWRKKMSDDILIHISLYAILGVVRVSLFLTPRCSLIWGIFWSWESEEVWHERIFLVIKHAGTDTTFSAATVSKQSGTVETHTHTPLPPSKYAFHPP